MLPFVKSHGLGNDYLVLEALPRGDVGAAVRLLCDRHRGVGADGVLVRVLSGRADFGVRIFNPDGSEAEKSGNGLRIFAKYLVDRGHAGDRRTFTIETPGGVVACTCRVDAGRATSVSVEMGQAVFLEVEMLLRLEDGPLRVTVVSVGNPHCVVFVERLDDAEARRLGPCIEHHPGFPDRTNVQFVTVTSRTAIAMLIWERGAGYTLASGSSACAAAAAAVRVGRCDPGPITVTMPGGMLTVDVRPDGSLELTGPAEEICAGTLSPELEARLDEPGGVLAADPGNSGR